MEELEGFSVGIKMQVKIFFFFGLNLGFFWERNGLTQGFDVV